MEPACTLGSASSGHYCSLFEIVSKELPQRGADTPVADAYNSNRGSGHNSRTGNCRLLPALCAPTYTKPPSQPLQLPIATGVRSGPAPLRLPEAFLKFLAHRGNRITHFPDHALQIVSGYAKPFFQASNLAGVSQVNLVANRRRLGVAHLGRLP
jgi:hypothetical protein